MGQFTTRLFIENLEVDLSENIDIPINYGIDNVRDISKVTSNYSKSITVPGTSNNNYVFNFLFDIKSTGTFPKNSSQQNIAYNYSFKKKAKAYVIQDNMVILSGYAKLINAISNKGNVKYEIQIV